MNLIFRPLDMWTDPETQNRKPAPFTARWSETLKLLDFEVDTLCNGNKYSTDVVLQIAAPERAMTRDGGIRADAKVSHPGVIITFDGPAGPMRFASDRFDRGSRWLPESRRNESMPAWQMNVRGIALALEALRKVDRYGVTNSNEQYTGFRALGSGIEMPPADVPMTDLEALEFLRIHAGWSSGPDYDDPEGILTAYRLAAKKLHPDAGGSTADFQRLQEAKRVLDI